MYTVQYTYNDMYMYILQTEILCVPSDILVEGDNEATMERREGERGEGDPTGIAQGGWKEEEGEGGGGGGQLNKKFVRPF